MDDHAATQHNRTLSTIILMIFTIILMIFTIITLTFSAATRFWDLQDSINTLGPVFQSIVNPLVN